MKRPCGRSKRAIHSAPFWTAGRRANLRDGKAAAGPVGIREAAQSVARSLIHPMCGTLHHCQAYPKTETAPVSAGTESSRGIVRVTIAQAIVNLLMVLPLWWRDGAWGSAWLVPELALLPLVGLWPAARRSRWLVWILAAGLTLAFTALLGDALVRAVFSRPLNILLDPWLLRAGFNLLQGSLGTPAAVIAAVLAAAGVAGTLLGMRALVQRALTPDRKSTRLNSSHVK
jgi:hypothetical protein